MFIQNNDNNDYNILGVKFQKKSITEVDGAKTSKLEPYLNRGLLKRLLDNKIFVKLTKKEVETLNKIKRGIKPSKEIKAESKEK